MKKIYLLFLAPLLLSFQCEEDIYPLYSTEFYIENLSNTDLVWISETAGETLIASQSKQFIAAASDEVVFIKPSENIAFESITLYKKEENGDLTVVYEQQPINDDRWSFNMLTEYEVAYVLIITNGSLTP